MAHTKADVVESTGDVLKAMDRHTAILKGAIQALENARRSVLMVTGTMPEISEEDVPASRSFIKGLADKISERSTT